MRTKLIVLSRGRGGWYLLSFFILFFLSVAVAEDKPLLSIPWVEKAPVIDGMKSSGEWDAAAVTTGFHEVYRDLPATPRTTVSACYDDNNLYILYEFQGDIMEQIQWKWHERDRSKVFHNSFIEFFIAPSDWPLHRNAHFSVNYETPNKWTPILNPQFSSASGDTDQSWKVELRLAWSELGLSKVTDGMTFRANFSKGIPERFTFNYDHFISWSPLRGKTEGRFLVFNQPDNFGTLRLAGSGPVAVIDRLPLCEPGLLNFQAELLGNANDMQLIVFERMSEEHTTGSKVLGRSTFASSDENTPSKAALAVNIDPNTEGIEVAVLQSRGDREEEVIWRQRMIKNDPEAFHLKEFHQAFEKVTNVLPLDEYATVARYDALYMGEALDKAIIDLTQYQGDVSHWVPVSHWGLSFRMQSLSEIYLATENLKYLQALHRFVKAALDARDDMLNLELWTGQVAAPVWSALGYARGRDGRAVYAVHTGVIVYPILDFLLLSREEMSFDELSDDDFNAILTAAQQSLDYHESQWVDGPSAGEGYYVGKDQEVHQEGYVLGANRVSAMGRSLWLSWKLSGNERHRDHALAIARYIKHRLPLAEDDDAYYWHYYLRPGDPRGLKLPKDELRKYVKKHMNPGNYAFEDTGHAALTLAVPVIMAADGKVFNEVDMARLGRTVTRGFGRLNNGILYSALDGDPLGQEPFIVSPAFWFHLTPYAPDVYEPLSKALLNYVEKPSPYALALMIKYRM